MVRRDTAPPKGTAKANPSKACGCHHRPMAKRANTIQVSPKMVQHDHSSSGNTVAHVFKLARAERANAEARSRIENLNVAVKVAEQEKRGRAGRVHDAEQV